MPSPRHTPNRIKKTNLLFGTFVSLLAVLLILVLADEEPEQRIILLSFDVEPVDGRQSVIEVMQVLQHSNTSATFFVTGQYAEERPDMVRMMKEWEIGVHGYSHKPFTRLTQDEKKEELQKTRALLEELTGQQIHGFRAPYNRIDRETLDTLEAEDFAYDASMIAGWGIIHPDIKNRRIGEIPVSSVIGVPIEDVVFLHYLKIPSALFYIMENKKSSIESYLFHPHHIAKHKKRLERFINNLKEQNAIFISHRELTETQHEGVQT